MFRNVPECSGMFHAPGFIDGHFDVQIGPGFLFRLFCGHLNSHDKMLLRANCRS